jgi:hypothetical protein
MFEKILIDPAALRRHRSAPFADERERYLQHCADFGAAPASLRSKSSGLLLLATRLGPDASAGVDLGRLQGVAVADDVPENGYRPQAAAQFMCAATKKILLVLGPLSRSAHKICGNIIAKMLRTTFWRGQTSHDRTSSATAPRLPDTDQCSKHAGAGRP